MTDPIRISSHPRSLANVLKNVVAAMGEPAASSKPGPNPYVQIVVESPIGPIEGVLRATGVGLYMGATDSLEIAGEDDGRTASVRVLAKNVEKTDVVDDLQKLAMAIQRTSTAKDARVHLEIRDRHSIAAYYGAEFLGELGEMDPEGTLAGDEEFEGFYEEFERELEETMAQPETTKRLAFTLDLIARLREVKADSSVVDYKVHPDKPLVALAMGPTFRALYAGIEREGYAAGGRWGGGAGSPASIIP